jgi:hypothetical protein
MPHAKLLVDVHSAVTITAASRIHNRCVEGLGAREAEKLGHEPMGQIANDEATRPCVRANVHEKRSRVVADSAWSPPMNHWKFGTLRT